MLVDTYDSRVEVTSLAPQRSDHSFRETSR